MAERVFDGDSPRFVRERFLNQLGQVSPLLSVLDVAAQRFSHEVTTSPLPDKAIRHLLSQFGASKVYVNASCIPAAIKQLHRAHIAYVTARADRLCYELRHHANVRGESRQNTPKKGDFLRWTVATLLMNQTPVPNIDFPPDDETMSRIFPGATLALVDYYRLCRNEEFHDELGDSTDSGAVKAFTALPLEKIKAAFGKEPSAPKDLTTKDAILCSKAWQDASVYLCPLLVWEELAVRLLRKRFSGLQTTRRRNGAEQFLRIECLWTEHQILGMIQQLGWEA